MRTLSLVVALLCSLQITAQPNVCNLRKMSESDRNAFLITKAKEVVLNFGPDYYREYREPEISGIETLEERKYTEFNGEKYYTVTFRYDKTKETLEWDYAARVHIMEKDGSESGDSILMNSNEGFERITVRELITRNRDYSYQVCADAADSVVVTAMYNRWVEGFSSADLMDSIALWGPDYERSIKEIARQRKETFGNIENIEKINFKSYYIRYKNIPGRWFLEEYEDITWEEGYRRIYEVELGMARNKQDSIDAKQNYDMSMSHLKKAGPSLGEFARWHVYTLDDVRDFIIKERKHLDELRARKKKNKDKVQESY